MSLPNTNRAFELLRIVPNPDGTVTRSSEFFPTVPPSTTDPVYPALSKDVPLDSEKDTWVRIFLPRINSPTSGELPDKKLPVVFFIHGGGFVLASPASAPFHESCSIMASQLGVMVVSISYRLAPEHRLPAAYDDVLEGLGWVKECKDEWLKEYADLSNCVLMGESAGGNITYHVGLRLAAQINDFKPLNVKGLVLIQPFFSGFNRSESETRLANNSVVLLDVLDLCWDLSLPVGSDRSHEYCDVIKGGGSSLVDRVRDLGWFVAVLGSNGDPLVDRNVELAKLMEQKGISVRSLFCEDGEHGTFLGGDRKKRDVFLDFVRGFWP